MGHCKSRTLLSVSCELCDRTISNKCPFRGCATWSTYIVHLSLHLLLPLSPPPLSLATSTARLVHIVGSPLQLGLSLAIVYNPFESKKFFKFRFSTFSIQVLFRCRLAYTTDCVLVEYRHESQQKLSNISTALNVLIKQLGADC